MRHSHQGNPDLSHRKSLKKCLIVGAIVWPIIGAPVSWALLDYGFRCVLAPSFADIFFNNCFKNGILPIVFNENIVEDLFIQVNNQPGYAMRVDLPNQVVVLPDGNAIEFEVDSFRKHALINGLDDIGLTLEKSGLIEEFESRRRSEAPWLFN